MAPPRRRTAASTARGGGRGRGTAVTHEEEGDTERWLVTYADMLTVMLALFIVLFAISALNESKFVKLKYSLAAVFGDGSIGVLDGSPALLDNDVNELITAPDVPQVPVLDHASVPAVPNIGGILIDAPVGDSIIRDHGAGPDGEIPVTASGLLIDTGNPELDGLIKVELDNFHQIQVAIDTSLDAAGMAGAVDFAIDRRGLIVTVVTDALVFPGNSATLLPKGQELLHIIAPPLAQVPNDLEVDGFTNQVDVSTYPYPSGWELSSARASSVVRYLEAQGLDDRQLAAVGYSDQRPLVPPEDPESITRNRRVEIVVLSSLPAIAGDVLTEAGEHLTGQRAGISAPIPRAPEGAADTTPGEG